MLKNKKIVDLSNSYFDSVTDSPDLFSCSIQIDNENIDAVRNILKKFHSHPSLIKTRSPGTTSVCFSVKTNEHSNDEQWWTEETRVQNKT